MSPSTGHAEELDEIAELAASLNDDVDADDPAWRQGYPYPEKLPRAEYERTKRKLQIGGAHGAHRAGAVPVVLPALRPAPAQRWGDRPVRPLLVQPRRRRARDGLLHAGAVPELHARGVRAGADAGPLRD